MSRSGYYDETDDVLAHGRWRAQVASSIRGNRGQAFLSELAAAMDAMTEKVLISEKLIDEDGDCCTMGVVCKARGLDISTIDHSDPDDVGAKIGITHQLAAEIAHWNDEMGPYEGETPEERWSRMRAWVAEKLNGSPK